LKDELQNNKWHRICVNQARAQDVGDDLNASAISKFTLAVAKDAFTYVLENILENENVTRALKHKGIDKIISFVKLTFLHLVFDSLLIAYCLHCWVSSPLTGLPSLSIYTPYLF
jgi:hypothetical protein